MKTLSSANTAINEPFQINVCLYLQIHSEVNLAAEGYITGDGTVQIVGLQHLPDMFCVCAATSSGELLLWNTTTGEVESVGSVDSCFTSMSWSPDGELLVLTTGAGMSSA